MSTGPSPVLLRAASGDYVGEGGTLNSDRSYAKRYASEEEAREDAKAHRIYSDFVAEPADVSHD